MLGQLLGGNGRKENALLNGAMRLLGSGSSVGGLSGLVSKFKSKGMDDEASSWVQPGANKSVSGRQVREAVGDEEIRRVAREADVSEDEAADGLAKIIPDAVDQLTPDGREPQGGGLDDALGALKSRFLGK